MYYRYFSLFLSRPKKARFELYCRFITILQPFVCCLGSMDCDDSRIGSYCRLEQRKWWHSSNSPEGNGIQPGHNIDPTRGSSIAVREGTGTLHMYSSKSALRNALAHSQAYRHTFRPLLGGPTTEPKSQNAKPRVKPGVLPHFIQQMRGVNPGLNPGFGVLRCGPSSVRCPSIITSISIHFRTCKRVSFTL
jgi:hypothetical protein